MCCDRSLFTSFEEVKEVIRLVGEHTIESIGRGQVSFKSGHFTINLQNCMYVPDMQGNFISVSSAV
ncbi:hypothetical protein CVS40_11552 [Lucilia cuprina]|nr:hypothetical protein CVS40_11552 [Lucilia cuprina]